MIAKFTQPTERINLSDIQREMSKVAVSTHRCNFDPHTYSTKLSGHCICLTFPTTEQQEVLRQMFVFIDQMAQDNKV